MMWIIPTYSSKMAENLGRSRSRDIFVGRQARALLNAMVYFENETQRWRAGRDTTIAHNNGMGRMVGQGRGLPCDRIPVVNVGMPELGVSHPGEGGAETSLSLHPPHLHQTLIKPHKKRIYTQLHLYTVF